MKWLQPLILCGSIASAAAAHELSAESPLQSPTSVLDRSPMEWARAEPDRWKDWNVDVPPPKAAEPLLLRVIDAFNQGDFPATLQALFELLELEPDFPSALHQSGVIYFRLRRYEDSIFALERYLTVAPHRVGDTRHLAHGYYSLGRYEKARAHYEKVLEVRSKSVEALRGLGLSYMRLGDPSAALAKLHRVLELDPTHANAATWIAQILFDEERLDEALTAVLSARELDPYEARTWFLNSQIYYELEQDEKGDAAKARFDSLDRIAQELRAVETQLLYEPRNSALYRKLVTLHREAGNTPAASGALLRWLRVEPRNLDLRVEMLQHAQGTQDMKSAAALAASIRNLAGTNVRAWSALANYYSVVGDRDLQAEAAAQVEALESQSR